MANLDNDELDRFLRYGPLLDNVEAVVGSGPAVDASIALQRDAANLYAGVSAEKPVTAERVRASLGELYLAYQATAHHDFLEPLQEMMTTLEMNPSTAPKRSKAEDGFKRF